MVRSGRESDAEGLAGEVTGGARLAEAVDLREEAGVGSRAGSS